MRIEPCHDRSEARTLPFRRRYRPERPPEFIRRIPTLRGRCARLALRVFDERAVGVLVQPLAIDAHRGRRDDPADRIVDQRFEQDRGARLVNRSVPLDGIHRLADTHFGGEVDDAVYVFHGPLNDVLVADVSDDQIGVLRKIAWPLLRGR